MGRAVEAERIRGPAQTVVLHRVNAPDALAAPAGTRPSRHSRSAR
jgi:hypothetical protein